MYAFILEFIKLKKLLHRQLSTIDDNITTKDFPLYTQLNFPVKNSNYFDELKFWNWIWYNVKS